MSDTATTAPHITAPGPTPGSGSVPSPPGGTNEPAGPRRLWPRILKSAGGILMLASILVVLFGSWAISASVELVFLCTLAWVGGFTLFVIARSSE